MRKEPRTIIPKFLDSDNFAAALDIPELLGRTEGRACSVASHPCAEDISLGQDINAAQEWGTHSLGRSGHPNLGHPAHSSFRRGRLPRPLQLGGNLLLQDVSVGQAGMSRTNAAVAANEDVDR